MGADDGPAPGEYAQSLNGYELPIAMEVRRGRYLKSFGSPSRSKPNSPHAWDIPLRDHDHVFLKGHRIMVQVQSTWFPVIDRNPQKFVPSIYRPPPPISFPPPSASTPPPPCPRTWSCP